MLVGAELRIPPLKSRDVPVLEAAKAALVYQTALRAVQCLGKRELLRFISSFDTSELP